MSKSFTTRMVGCIYAFEVWKRLDDHFYLQIRAKIFQLRNKLSSIKIGGSVNDKSENRNGARFYDYNRYGDGYNKSKNRSGSRFDDYGGGRQRPVCQVCDKVGHTTKMCWYRYEKDDNYKPRNDAFRPRFENQSSKEGNSSQVKSQPQQQTQALLATPANLQDQNWYLD
ncbi:hypothetical protein PIB30_074097 [Stylosanthes scabra]|uniref:Uncharacterized protein n=1 Tax=Stylosanthes scabra TaxID=79078 RepID=A0ABU6SPR4_9FABA|nr:hypothetical protein [Stylosanthes scabra]